MAKKKSGLSKTTQHNLYKMNGRFAKNKKTKIERHLAKHPEDQQAKAALDNVPTYSRAKPKQRRWTASARYLAALEAPIRRQIEHLNRYRPRSMPDRPKLVDIDPNLNTLMHLHANRSSKHEQKTVSK